MFEDNLYFLHHKNMQLFLYLSCALLVKSSILTKRAETTFDSLHPYTWDALNAHTSDKTRMLLGQVSRDFRNSTRSLNTLASKNVFNIMRHSCDALTYLNVTGSAYMLFAHSFINPERTISENLRNQTLCIQSLTTKIHEIKGRLNSLYIQIPPRLRSVFERKVVVKYANALKRLFEENHNFDLIEISSIQEIGARKNNHADLFSEGQVLDALHTSKLKSIVFRMNVRNIKAFNNFTLVSNITSLQMINGEPKIMKTLINLSKLSKFKLNSLRMLDDYSINVISNKLIHLENVHVSLDDLPTVLNGENNIHELSINLFGSIEILWNPELLLISNDITKLSLTSNDGPITELTLELIALHRKKLVSFSSTMEFIDNNVKLIKSLKLIG